MNTLGHGFVLDDAVVLTENKHVQQGWHGIPAIFKEDSFSAYLSKLGYTEQIITGGRYRPLSLALFAIGITVWGNAPLLFHLFNILLYVGAVLVFFRLLQRLMPSQPMASFAAALLFAIHPIHTEVVCNIKCGDELLAFILGGIALMYNTEAVPSLKRQLLSGLFLLSALLSKEIAIVWVVLMPLFGYIIWGKSLKKTAMCMVIPLLVTVGYLMVRNAVISTPAAGTMMQDPLNNPLIQLSGTWVNTNNNATSSLDHNWQFKGVSRPFTFAEKTATATYILGQYARLMVWPYPLSHDYSPFQITVKNWRDWQVLATFLLLLISGWYFLTRRNRAALGIFWFFFGLLPVCNLFFPIGTLLAERFLLLPSAGFCTAIGIWWAHSYRNYPQLSTALGAAILVSFGFLTILRNPAWVSNTKLLETDMTHTPESARIYFSLGDLKVREALMTTDSLGRMAALNQVLPIFSRGLQLHPLYYLGWHGIGAAHFYLKDYDAAIKDYQIALALQPNDTGTKQNLAASIRLQGEIFTSRNEPQKAILYLEKAFQLSPDSTILPLLARLKGLKSQ